MLIIFIIEEHGNWISKKHLILYNTLALDRQLRDFDEKEEKYIRTLNPDPSFKYAFCADFLVLVVLIFLCFQKKSYTIYLFKPNQYKFGIPAWCTF